MDFDNIYGFEIDGMNHLFSETNGRLIEETRMDQGGKYPALYELRFLRPGVLSGFATVAMRWTASLFRSAKFVSR